MRTESRALVLALGLLGGSALAQLMPVDPDWRELEVPPPPALRTTGLLPFEVPRSELRWGIDPASVSLGADGITRYVVVAQGTGGALNAAYEGIRCHTGEARVYARHSPAGWTPVRGADWMPLNGRATTRHALVLARSGVCAGNAANGSTEQVLRDLRAPVDQRFERR